MTPEQLKQTIQKLSASGNDKANILRQLKPKSPLSNAINSELNAIKGSGKSKINYQIYRLIATACSSKQIANYLPAIMQFVPSIIWNYLISVALQNDEQSHITPCLLKIYNDAVVDYKGESSSKMLKMPSISQPSIYNQSTVDKATTLTQSALRKHDRNHATVASTGPYCIYDQINASNRNSILYVIISIYNEIIFELPEYSHISFCQMCSRIANCGFENDPDVKPYRLNRTNSNDKAALNTLPRIYLNPTVINNMVTGLMYIMHNGHEDLAKRALKNIHYRASIDLMIDTLLVTNAALHALNESASFDLIQSEDLSHHLDAIARKGTLPEGTAEEGTSGAARKNLSVSALFSKSLDTLNEDKKYPMKAKSVEELHVTQQILPANNEDKINRRNKQTAVSVDNINLALANTKDMFKFQQEKSKSVPAVYYSEEMEV